MAVKLKNGEPIFLTKHSETPLDTISIRLNWGVVDTDEVYSFYYEVDNGGIKRGKVNADDTIIYEKENCTPHVVEYTTYTKNKMNNTLRVILAFGYGKSSHKTYEIYTTPGTVLRTFALDTQ